METRDYGKTVLGSNLQDATGRLFLILVLISFVGGTLVWLIS